ncbi:Macrophage killing protein with similarity to conjugation protein [Escherichia coli]|uniref:Macrophage killing protein with similarity to conjugation protein n=1 Tax=Escherichia coli TaxID=562 RepID=A0A2X1LBT1_ECOLX|nr:Macrophage killing protein with similarity to conjugation protein [Escherichia coli]
MNFGSMTLSEAFNLDFVHYRKQITTQAPRFSEAGFAGYVNALQASNILDTIKKEKFNLTTTIGAGTLVNQGQMEKRRLVLEIPVSGQDAPGRSDQHPPRTGLHL